MRRFARLLARALDFVLPRADSARLVNEAGSDALARLVSPRADDGIVSLLPYRHPLVRAAVLEAKFHDFSKATHLLASAFREYLPALEEERALSKLPLAFVPVPLSEVRLRARGYNQVERVLAAAGITSTHALTRVRDTAPQTTLPRAKRLENMEGAFRADAGIDTNATYVLVDDVTTTGATLRTARRSLEDAGAADVICLALSH